MPGTKLNQQIADKIRSDYRNGKPKGMTQRDLSKKYNIGMASISKIVNNLIWTNGGKRSPIMQNVVRDENQQDRMKIDESMEKRALDWNRVLRGN